MFPRLGIEILPREPEVVREGTPCFEAGASRRPYLTIKRRGKLPVDEPESLPRGNSCSPENDILRQGVNALTSKTQDKERQYANYEGGDCDVPCIEETRSAKHNDDRPTYADAKDESCGI